MKFSSASWGTTGADPEYKIESIAAASPLN